MLKSMASGSMDTRPPPLLSIWRRSHSTPSGCRAFTGCVQLRICSKCGWQLLFMAMKWSDSLGKGRSPCIYTRWMLRRILTLLRLLQTVPVSVPAPPLCRSVHSHCLQTMLPMSRFLLLLLSLALQVSAPPPPPCFMQCTLTLCLHLLTVDTLARADSSPLKSSAAVETVPVSVPLPHFAAVYTHNVYRRGSQFHHHSNQEQQRH